MAQSYVHPRNAKFLKILALKCLLILCAVVNSQASTAPTITSFTPSGKVGDFIEISGTGFETANRVYFGSGSTTVFDILDGGTKIRVQVPITANPGRIRVNNAYGSVYSKTTEVFAMPLAPTITSVSATNGVAGDEVTFTGTNLSGVTRVYFGSGNTTAVTVVDDNQIKVIVPATATTAKPILQSNEGRATSTVTFEIVGAPTIASFEPATAAVGAQITIKGTNLEGVTRIYIGSGSTTVFNFAPNGDILVDVPPTATSGSVRVYTNNGQASKTGFNLTGAPVIASISPLEGNAGIPLTITGNNIREAIRVYVGSGSTTDITVIDDNTIRILVPDAASTGTVRVQTNGGQGSSSQTFTVLSSPDIYTFEPTSGRVGTVVTITGQNFENATSVSFSGGSTTTFISKTNTEIKVEVPKTAYSGAITVVSTTGRKTSSLLFNVEGAPIINSFSPESGAVNSLFNIFGSNLKNATGVYIGGGYVAKKDFEYVPENMSDMMITIRVPASAATGTILVVSEDGRVTSTGIYTVTSAPVITSFDPGVGLVGSPVKIYGQNFTGAIRVYVGTGSVTEGFTVNAEGTEITVNVPNNSITGTVRVWTGGGRVTSVGTYVVLTPSITLSPNPLAFENVTVNGEETKTYTVSGENLTNGVPVSINVGNATGPFTISLTTNEADFGRTLSLGGITNNRLNATTIYVKYKPTEPTPTDSDIRETIAHTQGALTQNLQISATAIPEPQPVELATFKAKTKESLITLEWRTASETDNSHFEVEMSEDNLNNFAKISTVKSKAGNSAIALDYKFTHYYTGNSKVLYFRLKQVDTDGTFTYSKTLSVELKNNEKALQAVVVPNPINANSRIIFSSNTAGRALLHLNALNGQRVLVKEVEVQKGNNNLQLPLPNRLQSGMYILTIELDGKVQQVKIIKQ